MAALAFFSASETNHGIGRVDVNRRLHQLCLQFAVKPAAIDQNRLYPSAAAISEIGARRLVAQSALKRVAAERWPATTSGLIVQVFHQLAAGHESARRSCSGWSIPSLETPLHA